MACRSAVSLEWAGTFNSINLFFFFLSPVVCAQEHVWEYISD